MAMTLTQVWGAFLIFVFCPMIGGLPLTGWVTRLVSGKKLRELGTGNVGVSAAFYHGGRAAGILSVLMEAAKGIGVVLLARYYFPDDPVWEIIALIALVMGRYWFAQGAGTTNVVWGFVIHDWGTALLTLLVSSLGFTIFRERRQGRLVVLILLPIFTALRHSQNGPLILAVTCLSILIAWIYSKIPDDLNLPVEEGRLESRSMFQFFRGDRSLMALDKPLNPEKFGGKAANLGQLRAWGYPVPRGYVIQAGDDPSTLMNIAQPSPQQPVVVRSSSQDEDTGTVSAAGIYESFLNITGQDSLAQAIARCFASYSSPRAVQYRRDNHLPERGIAVIVQEQIEGQFSGVAFSRDPVARCGDAVVIESLPGGAIQVVSGQVTPEQYRIMVQPDDVPPVPEDTEADWLIPEALSLTVEGQGTTPSRLLQQVAYLARHLEARYHGIPQDIEWTYDGEQLWLLQSRPITTLQPIWTRKIAAEVIPGVIRPLTWSINRPLTCGVWGEIFSLVLGNRARGLNFEETATLHNSYAYFNASLLGDIFLRMGLPSESLEFLTRGAKFSRPPLVSTLRNLPGLLRLLQRELWLEEQFAQDDATIFKSGLAALAAIPRDSLSMDELFDRTEDVLGLLRRVTYYNIMAPLSFALRRAIFRVPEDSLDARQNTEIAAVEDLRSIAQDTQLILSSQDLQNISNASSLMAALAESTDGQTILAQLDNFIEKYGYLSPVGTDIAVPTWHENPGPVRELLAQFVLHPPLKKVKETTSGNQLKADSVQRRLNLKGQVNTLYNRLLAELRWCFLSIETQWLNTKQLKEPGDIFLLTLEEIKDQIGLGKSSISKELQQRIEGRKQRFMQDKQMDIIPNLVFGNTPPGYDLVLATHTPAEIKQKLSGIAASAGIVEGPLQVMTELKSVEANSQPFILVVPYTDAGWIPLLARAKGLVAEVGGRLSHGAIIAREYGIPAVMDVTHATQRLHTGQWIRLDGYNGTIEVLDPPDG